MTRRALFLAGVFGLWLVALLFIAKASLDRLEVPPWGNPVGDEVSAGIAGETRVGQRFTAPLPGLYALDVVLEPAPGGDPQPITFHLAAEPGGADLWSATFSSADLQPGVPRHFAFDPLRDSQGRTYDFYFESPASQPGQAPTVRYSPRAMLDNADATLDGQAIAGDLQFHSYYSLRTREKLDLLLTRMAQGRPYFWGRKGFYVGLALAYGLVLIAFLWRVARLVLAEGAGEP